MNRRARFAPQPALATHLWRKLSWNGLIHKSGRTCFFVGPEATRRRNETLRKLNVMPRPAKIRVGHIESL